MSLSIASTQVALPVQLPAAEFRPVGLPSGASPEQNAQWWNGLSAHERVGYLADHGSAIGSMDGLPSEVRHAANMETLREDARSGDGGAQSLLARIEESRNGQDPSNSLYLLEYTPADPASNWFDTKTDATAVVAISNPDVADNIAVFVPGTGSTVDSIGGNIDRMDALKTQAEFFDEEAATSTIVWLGYDAPDDVVSIRGPDATAIGPALDGAPALREFTHGLRASSEGTTPANLTVIGHSYGSTLVGYADRSDRSDGLGADNIIVAGSPGLSVPSADRLSIDNGSLWTAMADDDPIRHTPTFIHGTNPVNEGFGGTRIDNGGASGHSGYWNSGSEALRNQGAIVTGNEQLVTTREFR